MNISQIGKCQESNENYVRYGDDLLPQNTISACVKFLKEEIDEQKKLYEDQKVICEEQGFEIENLKHEIIDKDKEIGILFWIIV